MRWERASVPPFQGGSIQMRQADWKPNPRPAPLVRRKTFGSAQAQPPPFDQPLQAKPALGRKLPPIRKSLIFSSESSALLPLTSHRSDYTTSMLNRRDW